MEHLLKFAPALTFHIIYVTSHQTLHMKAFLPWVWKEFPLFKKKKKSVSHFMLLSYHWTCPHATFCFADCGFREQMSRGVRNLGINPAYKSLTKTRLFSGNVSQKPDIIWRDSSEEDVNLTGCKRGNSVCLGRPAGCYVTSVCATGKRKREGEPLAISCEASKHFSFIMHYRRVCV